MRHETLIDLSLFDVDQPIADIEEIRQYNPQRHEMEQLSAILYENLDDFCWGVWGAPPPGKKGKRTHKVW